MKDNDLEKIYENYLSVGMQQMDEAGVLPGESGQDRVPGRAAAGPAVDPVHNVKGAVINAPRKPAAPVKKGPSVQVAQAGADKMLINLANMVEADPGTWNTQLQVLKQTDTAFSDLTADAFIALMRGLAEQLGTSAVTGRVRQKYDAAATAAPVGVPGAVIRQDGQPDVPLNQ